jgi:hypothetical protein
MAGNPMTAHDITGFAVPFFEKKSGNKWSSRVSTRLTKIFVNKWKLTEI